jgi:hypothetical protein
MRLVAYALAMLLPLPAQAEMPFWWRDGAVWAGKGVQSNGPQWTIEIAIQAGSATISYPSIPCGGTLTVIGVAGPVVTLRETITDGLDLCITGGTIELWPEKGGSLHYSWSDPVSGMTATGLLAPPIS